MTNKELFDRWMALKFDIQSLAAIVQNDGMILSEDELFKWLQDYTSFITKINKLKTDIVTNVKVYK